MLIFFVILHFPWCLPVKSHSLLLKLGLLSPMKSLITYQRSVSWFMLKFFSQINQYVPISTHIENKTLLFLIKSDLEEARNRSTKKIRTRKAIILQIADRETEKITNNIFHIRITSSSKLATLSEQIFGMTNRKIASDKTVEQ